MTRPPPLSRQPAEITVPVAAARTGLPASVARSIARWPAQKYWVMIAPGTGQSSLPLPATAVTITGAGTTRAAWVGAFGVGITRGEGTGVELGTMCRSGSGSGSAGLGWITKVADLRDRKS